MNSPSTLKRFWMLVFANTIFVFHFAIVLVNVGGWLFPGWFFHVYLVAWALAFSVDVLFESCPLTYVEFGVRKKLNPEAHFDKSCIVHYLRKWRGLSPRPVILGQKTFWQRYSFLAIMIGLLVLSLSWQYFVYGTDIFYFW